MDLREIPERKEEIDFCLKHDGAVLPIPKKKIEMPSPEISAAVDLKKKYWDEMSILKVHSLYLAEYAKYYGKINSWLKGVLAVSSSSSICAWVIWENFGFVWASIIAASQLINAIKELLPSDKKIERIMQLKNKLDSLFLPAEYRWFDVSKGRLSSEEIRNLTMELKKENQKQRQAIFKNASLPVRRKLMDTAEKMAADYFDA